MSIIISKKRFIAAYDTRIMQPETDGSVHNLEKYCWGKWLQAEWLGSMSREERVFWISEISEWGWQSMKRDAGHCGRTLSCLVAHAEKKMLGSGSIFYLELKGDCCPTKKKQWWLTRRNAISIYIPVTNFPSRFPFSFLWPNKLLPNRDRPYSFLNSSPCRRLRSRRNLSPYTSPSTILADEGVKFSPGMSRWPQTALPRP